MLSSAEVLENPIVTKSPHHAPWQFPRAALGCLFRVATARVCFGFPTVTSQRKAFHLSFFDPVDACLPSRADWHIEVG
jgi:hypothetical protein